MKTKPKKFICSNCSRQTYIDAVKCNTCEAEGCILPIPKETYKCYLNGVAYGAGDLAYMNELFSDYVIKNEMYGKKECDFKIVKD